MGDKYCEVAPPLPVNADVRCDLYDVIIFTKVGVPNVEFMPGHRHCPYYLDPTFQDQFTLLIKALAAHIAELPASVQSKVVAGKVSLSLSFLPSVKRFPKHSYS